MLGVPLGLGICFGYALGMLHSKNTRVKLDPERVHWGQTPFGVNNDPEISQLDSEYDPELGQSDAFICQVCRKLTTFRSLLTRNGVWLNGPFPGHVDPCVFRVYI